jgi:hypothetical protein
MNNWLEIATGRDVLGRGVKVGLIVGTILTTINQGDVILAGEVTAGVAGKILLTYCVPFCVSTYASIASIVTSQQQLSFSSSYCCVSAHTDGASAHRREAVDLRPCNRCIDP